MIPTIATVFAAKSISALTEKQEEEFAQNNILFLDPTECSEQKKGGSSASVSVHPEDLPAETVQIFENDIWLVARLRASLGRQSRRFIIAKPA